MAIGIAVAGSNSCPGTVGVYTKQRMIEYDFGVTTLKAMP
jgi:hypothetical protein